MNNTITLYSGSSGWSSLQEVIRNYSEAGIFILVDENTINLCLPLLKDKCSGIENAVVIQLKAGESHKTIGAVEEVWQALHNKKALRKSLLICLGGGLVSDIGGFAAATYKRGMDFIYIPTTLLAMIDAAIGGKNGVNFQSLKNQIGIFALPLGVFVFQEFLSTLPARQKLSGYGEILKHAMIDSEKHFEKMLVFNSPEKVCNESCILDSAAIKLKIVNSDFHENGLRKALNFGHTIGHAIESYSQKYDPVPLLHGEAIAIGLICESFISVKMFGMDENDLKKMASLISWHFPHYRFKPKAADELLALMIHDKKNTETTNLKFSLLRKIGEPVYDQVPGEKLIRESLHFYMNLDFGFLI